MYICISQSICKTAFDFSIFRKVPNFLKNPIEALKKVVYDFMEKSPENARAVLDYVKKSPEMRNAGNLAIPILVISALLYLVGVLGKGFGESLEKKFGEAMDKELGRQQTIQRVIDEK